MHAAMMPQIRTRFNPHCQRHCFRPKWFFEDVVVLLTLGALMGMAGMLNNTHHIVLQKLTKGKQG
jgi:hypothetical protein